MTEYVFTKVSFGKWRGLTVSKPAGYFILAGSIPAQRPSIAAVFLWANKFTLPALFFWRLVVYLKATTYDTKLVVARRPSVCITCLRSLTSLAGLVLKYFFESFLGSFSVGVFLWWLAVLHEAVVSRLWGAATNCAAVVLNHFCAVVCHVWTAHLWDRRCAGTAVSGSAI